MDDLFRTQKQKEAFYTVMVCAIGFITVLLVAILYNWLKG